MEGRRQGPPVSCALVCPPCFPIHAVAAHRKRRAGEEAADIHALRHTFGMHPGKNGLAPRAAQAAMHHSPPLDVAMDVYTDLVLLDVGRAAGSTHLRMLPHERPPRLRASALGLRSLCPAKCW